MESAFVIENLKRDNKQC